MTMANPPSLPFSKGGMGNLKVNCKWDYKEAKNERS